MDAVDLDRTGWYEPARRPSTGQDRRKAEIPNASEENIDPSVKRMWKTAARFSHLGIFFGVAVVLGLFAGNWADRRFGTAPALTLVGLVVGLVAGFRELYRVARAAQRSAKNSAPVADRADADVRSSDDDARRGGGS